MHDIVATNLMRYFAALKDERSEEAFFTAISECVTYIKKNPVLAKRAKKLELDGGITNTRQAHFANYINFYHAPQSAIELWERMLFVDRVITRGKVLLTHKGMSIGGKRHREYLNLKSAVAEFDELRGQRGKKLEYSIRRPFFIVDNYKAYQDSLQNHFLKPSDIPQAKKNLNEKVYITKHLSEYRFNGQLIVFNAGTLYGQAFMILFDKMDPHGFVKYDVFEKEFRKLGHSAYTGKQSKSRISNALNGTQGFLKVAKINDNPFPLKHPNGVKVISVRRKEGFVLNNQK